MKFFPATVLCAALAAFVTVSGAAQGNGVSFAVDPITFTLVPPVQNATVTLTNLSNNPLRLQVNVLAWTQKDDGTMQLAPTTDAIVFPQLFTIAPSSSQRIRAAIVVPPSANERAFRISVTDLPSLAESVAAPRGSANVTIRTRFLVPLYVEPAVRTRAGHFENATIRGGRLSFALVNTGTVHLEGLTLPIAVRDASGAVVFSGDAGRWNVLAGRRTVFTVNAASAKCAGARTLAISPGGGTLPAQTVGILACS